MTRLRPCDRVPWMDELRPSAPVPLAVLEDEAALITLSALLRSSDYNLDAIETAEPQPEALRQSAT